MKCDLNGKVSLVTGAARGTGKAIADRLAANGSTVYYTDNNVDELRESAAGGRWLRLDVTNAEQIAGAVSEVETEAGRIDILVNNAGINLLTHRVAADQYPRSEWDRILAVDLTGVFDVTRAFSPLMRKQRSGRVINIASIAGIVPLR